MYPPNRRLLSAIVFAGLLAAAAPTRAHQQWLAPNFFSQGVSQDGDSAWLSFDHTFSDRRFHADSAPGLYYQWWIVGPDLRKRSVPFLFAGKTKIVGEVELTEPGTYRLEGEEANMVWTKLKVDGKDTWQPGPRSAFEGQEIVESKIYFAKALAYVTLGPIGQTVPGASGDPLEIVFQQHPNGLQAGRGFGVTLLSFGEPVAEQKLQLFSDRSQGHDPTQSCATDAKGSCEIVPESPGRYLLTARIEGPTPDDPKTDGFSYSVSVLVEVGPAPSS